MFGVIVFSPSPSRFFSPSSKRWRHSPRLRRPLAPPPRPFFRPTPSRSFPALFAIALPCVSFLLTSLPHPVHFTSWRPLKPPISSLNLPFHHSFSAAEILSFLPLLPPSLTPSIPSKPLASFSQPPLPSPSLSPASPIPMPSLPPPFHPLSFTCRRAVCEISRAIGFLTTYGPTCAGATRSRGGH